MADKHPYISAVGNITQAVTHLRGSFPQVVSADTLKKLGLAPKNENFLLGVLRFLGIIDQEGNRTEDGARIFTMHSDEEFADAFTDLIRKAYSDLFDLHGDKAWTLDRDSLITFFRSADQTSAITGQRQASTFQTLAAIAGRGEVGDRRSTKSQPKRPRGKRPQSNAATGAGQKAKQIDVQATPREPKLGLTIRIEVNLPAGGDQATYDRIFKSIRENLIETA